MKVKQAEKDKDIEFIVIWSDSNKYSLKTDIKPDDRKNEKNNLFKRILSFRGI